MKKIISLFLMTALMISVFSGCDANSNIKQESLDAIADSYSESAYYDREKKEIAALVSDYTEKINQAKNEEEIEQLKAEAIEKIGEVYTKEKVESIKAEGEEALGQLKGKILPYQKLRELLPKVKELLESDNYAEMDAAVTEFKEYLSGVSEKVTYDFDQDGVKFSFEAVYSKEDGIPVITYTFDDDVNNIELKNEKEQYILIAMSTICNSSILAPEVAKMISYNAMLIAEDVVGYCDEEEAFKSNFPELARCEVTDNSYKFRICTPEQTEALFSDSATFFNSDDVEIIRDTGDEDPLNYVTVLFSDPSTGEVGDSLADRLTWVIIL